MLKADQYDIWCSKCVNEFGLDTQAPCRACLEKTNYVSSCNRPVNFEPTFRFGVWCNKCVNKDKRDSSAVCDVCYSSSSDEYHVAPTRFVRAMLFDICCHKCVFNGLDITTYPCSECTTDFCDSFPTEYREGFK